ncbi:MAG: hypothetical protein ABJP79_11005 [Tateyamaria sp.]|uniref:hypothetical protein n=1 Tax=Tateyamaria sp. TaxID=1929288 RepID=UPI00329FDEE1
MPPFLLRTVRKFVRNNFASAQNRPDCAAIFRETAALPIKASERGLEQMTKQRFIKSAIQAAKEETPQMPWARGTRRAAFIAKRQNPVPLRKSA